MGSPFSCARASRLPLAGALVACALVVAACSEGCCVGEECAGTADAGPATAPRLTFVGLPAAAVTCADDAEPSRPGEELDVQLQLVNTDAAAFEEVSVVVGDAEFTGRFDDAGRATVRVTLTGAADGAVNSLEAKATGETSTLTTRADVVDSCDVRFEPPACAFLSPAEGGTLAGAPAQVAVVCGGGNPADARQQALLRSGVVKLSLTSTSGAVTRGEVQLAGFEGTGNLSLLAPGEATLTLALLDPAGLFDPPLSDEITVSALPPDAAITITAPALDQIFDGDDDGDLNGIDVPIEGLASNTDFVRYEVRCDEDGNPANGEFVLAGDSDDTLTLSARVGGIRFAGVMRGLPRGLCSLSVFVDNARADQTFAVQADVPTFQVSLEPDSPDGMLSAADDLSLADDILEVTSTWTPSRVSAGLIGVVVVTSEDGLELVRSEGAALIENQPFAVRVPFPHGDRTTYSLAAFATDGVLSSPPVVITRQVDTEPPTVRIVAPPDGASLGLGADADPLRAGVQLQFAAIVTGAENGASFDVVDNGSIVGRCTHFGGTCTADLTWAPGSHALTVVVADGAGNTSTATSSFALDAGAPVVLRLRAVADRDGDGLITVAENGPADGPVSTDVLVDFDPAARIEDGRVLSLRIEHNGDVETQSATAAANGARFAGIDLAQGLHALTVLGEDAAGNPVDASSATANLFVDTVAPSVAFRTPGDGEVLDAQVDASPDAGIQVTIAATATDAEGEELEVREGPAVVGRCVVQAASCTTLITVTDGAHTITLTVTDDAGNPTTASRRFFVDSGLPIVREIFVAADLDRNGAVNAAEAGGPGTDPVISDVTVRFLDSAGIEDGRTVTLTVRSDATILATQTASVTTNAAVIQGVLLPQGALTLIVTGTDGSGNPIAAAGAALSLLVDTILPTVDILAPLASQVFTASDDASPAPGFQTAFSAAVGGVEDGVVLDVVEGLAVMARCTVAGGACEAVITFADGPHVLSLTATDPAGNVSSASRAFQVDAAAPRATQLVVTRDLDGNGVVNIAENGSATIGAVSSTVLASFIGLSEGRVVTLTLGGAASGTLTASVVNGQAVFAAASFGQGTSSLVLGGTNEIGVALSGQTTASVLVDTVAPALSVTAPEAGVTLAGADDADGNQANGFQTDVEITSDAETRTVGVTDNGNACGSAAVQTGRATIRCAAGEGARTLVATVSDAAGNSASASVGVVVDSTGPVLTLTCPAAVNPSTDEDPGADGLQSTCTVATSGLEAGRIIDVESDQEPALIGSAAADASGTTRIVLTYTAGATHRVLARSSDTLGNAGASTAVTVVVVTDLYEVSLTTPPVRAGLRSVGLAEDVDDAIAGAQVIVTGETDAPPTATATLLIDGVAAATCAIGSNSIITCGAVTLADRSGGTLALTVADAKGEGTSPADGFRVDLGAPTVALLNPPGDSLINPRGPVTFTSDDDLQPGINGFQTTVLVEVSGCENGIVMLLEGQTELGRAAVDASGSGDILVPVTDLVSGDNELWTVTCVDADGNAPDFLDFVTVSVDLVAPTTPALNLEVLSVRQGLIRARFIEPGDDGTSGGNVATLELVASRQEITLANFDALAGVANTPGNGGLLSSSIVGAGASRAATSVPLAFDNAWRFGLRMRDDAGNTVLATAAVALSAFDTVRSARARASGELWNGLASGTGDLDGDGANDIVVVASGEGAKIQNTAIGAVHIFGGSTDVATARTQTLTAPAGVVGFGQSAALADLDGDGRADLVVSAFSDDLNRSTSPPVFPSETRIFLYYSRGGASFVPSAPDAVLATPFDPNNDTLGDLAAVFAVGDVSADGLEDVVLTSASSTFPEFVLLRGAPARLTSSSLAAVSTTTTVRIGTAGGGAARFLPACTGIGQLDGDPAETRELVVATDGADGTNQLWLLAGRTSWPATLDLGVAADRDPDGVAADPIACSGTGCGRVGLSAGDVNGDGLPDLVVPNSTNLQVHTGSAGGFSPAAAFLFLAPELRRPAAGTGSLGVIGDVNGDGIADILVPQHGANPRFSLFFGHAGEGDRAPDVEYPATFASSTNVAVGVCGDVDNAADAIDDICFFTANNAGVIELRR